jgi:hypothetical protein
MQEVVYSGIGARIGWSWLYNKKSKNERTCHIKSLNVIIGPARYRGGYRV